MYNIQTLFGHSRWLEFPRLFDTLRATVLTRNLCPEDYDCVQLGLNQEKNPAHSTPPLPPMIRNLCIMALSQNGICGKVSYLLFLLVRLYRREEDQTQLFVGRF